MQDGELFLSRGQALRHSVDPLVESGDFGVQDRNLILDLRALIVDYADPVEELPPPFPGAIDPALEVRLPPLDLVETFLLSRRRKPVRLRCIR
jgi:hypothetical protein